MNKKFLALLLSVSVVFAGCSQENNKKDTNDSNDVATSESVEKEEKDSNIDKNEEKKVVYTSFYPIYDITKQIAGEKLDVNALASLETEAHDWEASAKDIAMLNDAEILIVNGAGMESWKDSVEKSSDIEILDTSKDLDLIKPEEDMHEDEGHMHEDEDHMHEDEDHMHEDEGHMHEDGDHMHEDEEGHHHHNHGEYDPHTWLSPMMGKLQAEVIYKKLAEIDPDNADYYEANYEKLSNELDEIISDYKNKFENVKNNEFVVPHEAFAYLCRDFNLVQIPLTGITSTQEPDAKTMQEVTELAKEKNITTIFYEKGGSDKAANAIAKEIGGEAKPLSTLEFVSKEELDKEVHYQDLVKENLEVIYNSLEK